MCPQACRVISVGERATRATAKKLIPAKMDPWNEIGQEDKTMALKGFTLIPALALMLAPAAAFADAIPVANPSFETLPSGGLNNFLRWELRL
jgi:hypothetical protein